MIIILLQIFFIIINAIEINYERWMSDLPEYIRDRSIAKLAMPGTHDSFTYVG